ncbi:MAG TPA: DUF58 domain-containing protein [Gemmatimonadales bacterium]|nr:DUF58 domain-containing protein [Gemmatimonadales bacterium]
MSGGALAYRFVTASTLALVRDLELAAHIVVDGMMLGQHTSRRAGAGFEFSQYRSYQPGDDLRRLDWKLLGRSDRYFVREAETETSVTVRILLDATGSMAHEEAGVSKLDYARYLAAALMLLAHRQGDAVGLYVLGDGRAVTHRPRREPSHLHRLLHELERIQPAGRWPVWSALERAVTPDAERGITIFLGDFHERGDEIRAAVKRLAGARHEVICFQVLGDVERAFAYRGTITLEELETGRRLDLVAEESRDLATATLEQQLRDLRYAVEESGAALVPCLLAQPFEGPLREYLGRRSRYA